MPELEKVTSDFAMFYVFMAHPGFCYSIVMLKNAPKPTPK
jgi:hypothetical protein